MAIAGRMEGWIALVTGASSGIGLALARECARQGAWVALAARRSDRLKELKREIEKMGGMAMICTCDVTDAAQVNRTVKRVVNQWGGLDLVVANAGFSVTGSFESLSVEDYRRQFETNVFGVIHTVKAVMPHLIESEGRLGIMSSIAGFIGYPGASAYCASKFALRGLAESWYSEFARKGVAVTCISPGFVESEIGQVDNKGKYDPELPDLLPTLLAVPASRAAKEIVRALHKRQFEAIITRHGRLLARVSRYMPYTTRISQRLSAKPLIKILD